MLDSPDQFSRAEDLICLLDQMKPYGRSLRLELRRILRGTPRSKSPPSGILLAARAPARAGPACLADGLRKPGAGLVWFIVLLHEELQLGPLYDGLQTCLQKISSKSTEKPKDGVEAFPDDQPI